MCFFDCDAAAMCKVTKLSKTCNAVKSICLIMSWGGSSRVAKKMSILKVQVAQKCS